MNNRSLPNDTQLMDIPPHPTVRPLKEIFNASLFARTTLPLWAMFFWLNYAAYGLSMWLKAYLGKLGMDEVVRDLYIWLSIGKILGLLVCASVIEHLPRRRTLGVAFFMSGVCTFAAVMVHGGEELVADYAIHISGSTLVLFLFSAAAFFEEAAWGTMYTYSVEVYPSSIRSTGSGAAMAFGRFGGIIATSIGKKLMQEDPRLPFYIVSLAFLLATVAVGVSRVETKGAKLADLS
jgi:putative MFS transporter